MKRMFVCSVLALICAWFTSVAAAETVVAVGSLKSLDALLEKATDVAEAAKNDKLITILGSGKMFFTEKGPVGTIVDTSRPAGLVAFLKDGECEGCPVAGFVAIPIRNWEKLESFLKSKGVTLEKQENGLWKLAGPGGKDFYGKKVENWLLASDKECGFAKDVDFVKYITENTEKVDVGFSLFIAQVPDKYKEWAVDELGKHIQKCAKRHCRGNEPSEAAVAAYNKIMAGLKKNLTEMDTITYGHFWNADADEYSLSVTVTGKEGTKLAKKLADIGKPRATNFAGFRCEDATLVIAKNGIIRPFAKELLEKHAAKHAEKVESKIREKAGDCADGAVAFFKENQVLVKNLIEDGNIDSALMAKIAEDNFVVAAARYVPDGYAWEAQFKKVVAFVKEKKADEVEKHVLKSGNLEKDGKHIYWAAFALPEKLQGEKREAAIKALGGEELHVTLVFAPKAVYFAAGKEAGKVLRKCVADSKEPKELSTFYVRLSAMDVLKAGATCEKCQHQDKLKKAVKKIGDVGPGNLILEPLPVENGVKIRFRATTSAIQMLKAI